MAKVRVSEILTCSECSGDVCTCADCNEYFKKGDDCYCSEENDTTDHYCYACYFGDKK